MVATFDDLLTSINAGWCLFVQLEGVGPLTLTDADYTAADSDGRYRFCSSRPTIAEDGTQPTALWLDYLAEMPRILSESATEFGGVAEYGGFDLAVVDVGDILTRTLRTESIPLTTLTAAAPRVAVGTAESFDVQNAGRLTDDGVIFANSEAMRVTNIAGNTVSVIRGHLGTETRSHDSGDAVLGFIPYLRGRLAEVYVMPLEAPWSERELVGRYSLTQLSYDGGLNTFIFGGDSRLRATDTAVPREPRSLRITQVANPDSERPEVRFAPVASGAPNVSELQVWSGTEATADRLFYVANGGEVVGVGFSGEALSRSVLFAGRRVAETEQKNPAVGDILTQVLTAAEPSSFRYSAVGSTSRSSGTWVKSDHWVDLCLCILTSSNAADDGLELTNFNATYGNWSCLPPGYGVGIPHAQIDWESWLEAKRRTDELRFPNFVYGNDLEEFGRIMTREFLRPVGAYLVQSEGLIRVILPSNPLSASQSLSLTAADVLTRLNSEQGREMDVSPKKDLIGARSEIRHTVGPREIPAAGQFIRAGQDPATEIIPVPSAATDSGPTWANRAASRTARRRSPSTQLTGRFFPTLWRARVGQAVNITLPGLPDAVFGERGWVNVLAQVLSRNIEAVPQGDEGSGVVVELVLKNYSLLRAAYRVAPSARVLSVNTNAANIDQDVYTCDDAVGLPDTDTGQFATGQRVARMNLAGVIQSGTQSIVTIIGSTLTLDGNFGGALTAGDILCFTDYDNALLSQRILYAHMADRDNGLLGPIVTDQPQYWGDL